MKKKVQGSIKIIFPWLIAAFVFYYLFSKYPLHQLIVASQNVNWFLFIGYSVFYFLFMWLIDCWTLSWLFSRFGFPTLLRDLMRFRFASYLLMVFNFGAGQGFFAYFFKKRKGVPFFVSSSLILFIIIIDLYWTVSFAFIGSFFNDLVIGGVNLSPIIQTVWGGASVALISLILFCRLPLRWRAINWVRTRDLFHTFNKAKLSDYGIIALFRLPMLLAVNTTLFFLGPMFHAPLPFIKVISYMPIIILIGALPITPGGMGTMQLATVEFFKDFVPDPSILVSLSLLFMFTNYLLKAIAGSIFIKGALRTKEKTT
jgi:uncharacterized membrane protein YbhN (UPF0104 family)